MPKVVEGLVSFWEPPDHRATPIIVDDHLDPVRHHSRHVSQNQVNPEVGLPAEVSQQRSNILETLKTQSISRVISFGHSSSIPGGSLDFHTNSHLKSEQSKKAKRLGGKRIQAGSFSKPNQAV